MPKKSLHIYKGFLFGHYDSRGGTTFVESDSLQDACKRVKWSPDADWEEVRDEDFIGEATITSEKPLENGVDLDNSMHGDPKFTAWVHGKHQECDNGDYLQVNHTHGFRIYYGEERPEEDTYIPRWDDDAWGLLFVAKGFDFYGKEVK